MEMLEFVLLLLAAVLVSAVLDQMMPRVSLPLVQIAIGAIVILLVGTPVDVAIDPELFLVLFIAPLLFDESRHASKRGLWDNKGSIVSLAIGLVIVTVLVVGFVLNWIEPSIPLAAAFALGAEGVACVGTKFVIWRKSEKVEQEKKKAAAKKPAKKVSGNYNPVKAGLRARKQAADLIVEQAAGVVLFEERERAFPVLHVEQHVRHVEPERHLADLRVAVL